MNRKLSLLSIIFGIFSAFLPLIFFIEFYSDFRLFWGNIMARFAYLVCSANDSCFKLFIFLFLAILPLILGIIGIILGGKAEKQKKSKTNIIGIVLSVIGIIFSSLFLFFTILYGGI